MPDKGARRSKDESLKVLWKQFNSRFKTEEDCAEELFKRHSEAIQCRHCNCTEIESNYGARFGRCKKCRRKFWFTSGTFFNRIRLARPWLAAIWLMERGITINAGQLHRLVDIAISSAWALLKKLSMVIKNVMDSQPAVEQASENFAPAICKRSLETPAKLHPTN